MRDYFPDIEAAIEAIRADGYDELVLVGHSTGGLTVCLWAAEARGRSPVRGIELSGIVLNSPNLGSRVPRAVQCLINPIFAAIAHWRPAAALPGRLSPHYARSLHRQYAGEWDFETRWKSVSGTRLRLGWLVSVHRGQRHVRKGLSIPAPILVLCSTASGGRRTPPQEQLTADTVLDVRQIARLSPRLGLNVTCVRIAGAMHDVFLSRVPSRDQAFDELSQWLRTCT